MRNEYHEEIVFFSEEKSHGRNLAKTKKGLRKIMLHDMVETIFAEGRSRPHSILAYRKDKMCRIDVNAAWWRPSTCTDSLYATRFNRSDRTSTRTQLRPTTKTGKDRYTERGWP
jgi:hypothetical protein